MFCVLNSNPNPNSPNHLFTKKGNVMECNQMEISILLFSYLAKITSKYYIRIDGKKTRWQTINERHEMVASLAIICNRILNAETNVLLMLLFCVEFHLLKNPKHEPQPALDCVCQTIFS